MSRTYRKRSITEKTSLVKYIDKHMRQIRNRRTWEFYMTYNGNLAYKQAIKDWETAYGYWLNSKPRHTSFYPVPPTEYEFKNLRVSYKEYNHDEEVDYAVKKYKKYSRDGHFYENNLNRTYKKYFASELRVLNRCLSRKIVKGDDSWEDKSYPDIYLSKKYIWDLY